MVREKIFYERGDIIETTLGTGVVLYHTKHSNILCFAVPFDEKNAYNYSKLERKMGYQRHLQFLNATNGFKAEKIDEVQGGGKFDETYLVFMFREDHYKPKL